MHGSSALSPSLEDIPEIRLFPSEYKRHAHNSLFLPIIGAICVFIVIVCLLGLYFRYRHGQTNHNRVQEVEMQQISGAVEPDIVLEGLSKIIYQPGSSAGAVPFQQDRCTLCLCDYDDGNELTLLSSCGHVYHSECIGEHLSRNTICPICRKPVSPVHGVS
jgi:hypothetical protein